MSKKFFNEKILFFIFFIFFALGLIRFGFAYNDFLQKQDLIAQEKSASIEGYIKIYRTYYQNLFLNKIIELYKKEEQKDPFQ